MSILMKLEKQMQSIPTQSLHMCNGKFFHADISEKPIKTKEGTKVIEVKKGNNVESSIRNRNCQNREKD